MHQGEEKRSKENINVSYTNMQSSYSPDYISMTLYPWKHIKLRNKFKDTDFQKIWVPTLPATWLWPVEWNHHFAIWKWEKYYLFRINVHTGTMHKWRYTWHVSMESTAFYYLCSQKSVNRILIIFASISMRCIFIFSKSALVITLHSAINYNS